MTFSWMQVKNHFPEERKEHNIVFCTSQYTRIKSAITQYNIVVRVRVFL